MPDVGSAGSRDHTTSATGAVDLRSILARHHVHAAIQRTSEHQITLACMANLVHYSQHLEMIVLAAEVN